MKIFFFLYMLVTLAIVAFRVESWPISNFSVFRIPMKIERSVGYRWLLIPKNGGPAEYYKFLTSKVHDSLAISIESLEWQKGGRESIQQFIKTYIGAELRIAGRYQAGTVVRVLRSEVMIDDQYVPGARTCWERGEGGYYCVIEKIYYEFTL